VAFNPSDLDSIVAWWRGEDIPSGTPDPLNWDDNISSWRLDATGSAIPTYNATAINSLPGLDFDDVDDVLSTTSAKAVTGQISIAIVCRLDSLATTKGLWNINTGSTATLGASTRMAPQINTASTDNYMTSSSFYERYAPVIPTATDMIITATEGSSQRGIWVNGDLCKRTGGGGTTRPPEVSDSVYVHIGQFRGGEFWEGYICEVVYWVEPYDQIHRQHIEGFLADKYGITLPTWHPFYSGPPSSGPGSSGGGLLRIGMNGGIN